MRRSAHISVVDQLRGCVRPLLVSIACVLAILALRPLLDGQQWRPVFQLAALSMAGAAAFIAALLLIDRPLLREAIALARARSASKQGAAS